MFRCCEEGAVLLKPFFEDMVLFCHSKPLQTQGRATQASAAKLVKAAFFL